MPTLAPPAPPPLCPELERLYEGSGVVETPRGELRYVQRGSGPALLLLHGVPLSLLTWRYNIDALARSATVVALDMLGYGRSAKPPGRYGVADQARAVLAALDALALPRVTIVGSSYGGAVALQAAAMQPPRVAGLVLLNPVAYPGARHSLERVLRIGFLTPALRAAFRHARIGRRLLHRALRGSYVDPAHATSDLADAYYALLRHGAGDLAYLATLHELREAEVAALAAHVTHDALIVWGARDGLLPVANGRRLRDALPNARLEVLAHCAHLAHEEDPASVNALIAKFVSARAAPAAGSAPARSRHLA